MNLVREVSDLANEVIEAQWALTPFEALQIAVKIQHNRVLQEAFRVENIEKAPGAIEAIAITLGYTDGWDAPSGISNAIHDIADELAGIKNNM
jgi:hypothetical protein